MATLVLTAAGTALGGPLGGALGGLIGQSIDQGLFGAGMRRGPRMGDLAVQTSSYGSPVPRIYGWMRVAGTVVWATDLQEEEAIEGGGKGSPERVSYRYSVSLAVALSSRPIRAVRRIWADGKLIRGMDGDFTVRATFRLLTGNEDQPIDPQIASIEGVSRTPAYRGLALAIFEDLELTEFSNRIPLLTFEIEADDDVVTISKLLADASKGLIEPEDGRPIGGYAAYGASIAESIRPIIELRGLQLAERDGRLRTPPASVPIPLTNSELGCGADSEKLPRAQQTRMAAAKLPASLLLTYYDPQRDYQSGQMRASSGGSGARDERSELPAVLTAGQAKQWAEEAMARRWLAATSVRLCLPPSRIGLQPGDDILHPGSSEILTVRSAAIEGMAVIIEAEAATAPISPLPADPGRAVPDPDVPIGRSEIIMFELPAMGEAPESVARAFVAASNMGRWKPLPVELQLGADQLPPATLMRRAVLGQAETVLESRSPPMLDELSSVTIRIANGEQLLLNADAEALVAGANLAIVGDELIQYGRAEQLAPGLYRLSRLLRGRHGTEWAATTHAIGEPFCLIDAANLQPIDLPASAAGAALTAIAHGIGDVAPLPDAHLNVSGEALRPPPVCHLRLWRDGTSVGASWVRRSHRGWAWNDHVGVADDPFPERYRVVVIGPGGQLAIETETPSASLPVASLPAGAGQPVIVSIAMIGPMALSREASGTITI